MKAAVRSWCYWHQLVPGEEGWGTLGSGELHVAVMVKTSTVGPDASLPVVALSVENGTIILLSMLLG